MQKGDSRKFRRITARESLGMRNLPESCRGLAYTQVRQRALEREEPCVWQEWSGAIEYHESFFEASLGVIDHSDAEMCRTRRRVFVNGSLEGAGRFRIIVTLQVQNSLKRQS